MTTTTAPPAPQQDERVGAHHGLASVLKRPEVGAAVAALLIFLYFAFTTSAFATPAGASTWVFTASSFAIMAVAVALLMIGGEFDLSAGAMTGTTGLITGIMMTHWGVNVWIAVVVSLVAALAIGFVNGFLVMKTGLPSFIVTLGTFFVLRGVNLAVTKLIINQVSVVNFQNADGYNAGAQLFGAQTNISLGFLADPGQSPDLTLYSATFWAIAVIVVATYVLQRTRAGNWIFAVGGAQTSARQTGVPVFRTKVGLFMTTAVAGWLVGMLSLFKTTTAQSTTGVGQEFVYIICAVVGGCLLTGGYGSAVGAALGALIYGMVGQGIVYAGWDSDWLYAFLGVMLLGAVLVNNWVKQRAESLR
ncbi:MAG: ribose transporter permease [Nocardioidaceae bacterium]|nr:ribose transporter permease [Nocardioidaceae bacterium]